MLFSNLFAAINKTLAFVCVGLSICGILKSQSDERWIELKQSPNANFYTIKQAFDSAWAGREAEMRQERINASQNNNSQINESRENENLDGTFFQYKRWEAFMEPRVYPSGDISLTTTTYQRFMDYLNANPAAMAQHNLSVARSAQSNSWSFMGPTGAPTGSGAGRLCCVRFDPSNANTMYVGTPAGGLWKSLDAGGTWNCLTDFLPAIGCSDVAIDPNNSNIIYMGSGDNDAGDSPSIGVMKSIDGGLTWNQTGLSFGTNTFRRLGRILIDPTNSNIVYAATSYGIFKTYDAGANWYRVSQANTSAMEFKPGDPNTLYACHIGFYKSTNGGATWTQIATGLPQTSTTSRVAIAVTPNAPNNVYLVAARTGSQAFDGVYLSTNDGNSFSQQSTSPNLLGWDVDGSDNTGQGWYGIAIAVAPYNANVVIVGGVNVWRSDDMGANWTINAHWYGAQGNPYVHADVHAITFSPILTNSYFIGCDGGIFKTENDGSTFSDISNNLCIAQIYRGGVSGSTAGKLISGHQDNGTNVKSGASYFQGLGGDGMDCFIDRTNDNNMFGELYYGDFNKSTNGGNNWNSCNSGLPTDGAWVTPWEQDPVNPNILYGGFSQLYKSTNQGGSWFALGTTVFGNLADLEVAPSNTNYIYVTTGASTYRSTDAGINWTVINQGLSGYNVTRIAVSSYDANKVWVTVSGYTNNAKVFFSTNGGTTWTNISYGLPNLPANCIRAVPGTSCDAVYVGMDAGVYYRDNNSISWIPFFTNLPNVPVYDLDIFAPTMMLTAFTYGRGVWQAQIDQTPFTPYANFSASPLNPCPGQTVQFTDLSTFSPSSWTWSFPGGNPSTSIAQNPAVVYNTPGTYPVTLIATNGAGSGTTTQTTYITVSGTQQPPYVEGFVSSTFVPSGWSIFNAGNPTYFWKRSATIGHNSTESAYFDNSAYSVNGEQDEIRSMGINFTGYNSLSLSFDVAYARYNNTRSDTLEVLVSTDCGATWNSIYLKGGAVLSTAANQTSAFAPTNSQWRNESMSINSYAGQSNVLFAFRNRGHHGNNLYVDNINITGAVSAAPVANFYSPASICVGDSASFLDISSPQATSWSWTFPGGNPSFSNASNPSVIWNTPGVVTISLVATNSFGSNTITQNITINGLPTANAGPDSTYCNSTYVQLNASGGVNYDWTPSNLFSNPHIASPGVFPTASTTYTVTAIDINGCSASDSVNIVIRPLPTFSVIATPSSFCYGDSVVMLASNPAWTYSWSPAVSLNIATGDSVIATPSMTTTYTITSVDSNGCSTSNTKLVTVYPIVPTPTVLVFGWTLICSTPSNFYQWYLNGTPIVGATSQTYTATVVGNYSVEAYSSYNCYSGISPDAFVDGIVEHYGPEFLLMPNPNNGVFDLSFNTTLASDNSITIFTIDGKLIYVDELNKFSGAYKKQINLSSFGAGLYLVRLSDGKSQSVQHVIVY